MLTLNLLVHGVSVHLGPAVGFRNEKCRVQWGLLRLLLAGVRVLGMCCFAYLFMHGCPLESQWVSWCACGGWNLREVGHRVWTLSPCGAFPSGVCTAVLGPLSGFCAPPRCMNPRWWLPAESWLVKLCIFISFRYIFGLLSLSNILHNFKMYF